MRNLYECVFNMNIAKRIELLNSRRFYLEHSGIKNTFEWTQGSEYYMFCDDKCDGCEFDQNGNCSYSITITKEEEKILRPLFSEWFI